MLKTLQKQNKEIQNKQQKKNIAFFSDDVEEFTQHGVDLIQDSQNKLINIRVLGELDEPLSTNLFSNQNLLNDNQKKKNMQNFNNDLLKLQNRQGQNIIQENENTKNNTQNKKIKDRSSKNSLSPQQRQQLSQDQQIFLDFNQKQIFEELDMWKNELENNKRIKNYSQQMFSTQGQSFFSQEIPNKRNSRIFKQISTQNLNSKQIKNQSENIQNNNIDIQGSKQINSISNDIQFQIDNTKQNIFATQHKKHSNVKENFIQQEPQLNENILNSIINNYEPNSSNSQKINQQDDYQQKHLLSNGASPQMKRKVKSKYYQNDSEAGTNQFISHQKSSSLQIQQNYDSQNQESQNKIKVISQPKKTMKQIQSETNEMVIEKLFLFNLKKKIEPLHKEHIEGLRQRFLSTFKEQNSMQDSSNEQKQKQQFQLRLPSPRGNDERQNQGFISERISRPQNLQSLFFQKQQEIVKDEMENFQKKTLDSFKFIQQIKRAKSGTPSFLNLINNKKSGAVQNQTKTEQYIQQLEKEFAMNQVKQSAQLTKNLEDAYESTLINEQVQQQLLHNYKQTVNDIKEKKDILESSRLESYKLQSIVNQIQEEKKELHSKLKVEIEKAAIQKFQILSRQNNPSEQEQDPSQINQIGKNVYQLQKTQRQYGNLNSLIQEQQKNIQTDFDLRQRTLSNKIKQLQELLKENQFATNSLQEELSILKNSKLTKKKQLKNYYLSLLQQNKSQISIIKLIEYMKEIDEEIDEKMLPNYFDQENIHFVKKLQRLSINQEKLQEELQIVSKSTKNSLHSQIQLNKLMQSQQEFISSPHLQSSINLVQQKKPFQQDLQSQIEIKMNNKIMKHIVQGSSPALSQSMISQNLVSNRNWEDEDKKLLKMMIGNEINHKKEIKNKLSNISKNTLQIQNQSQEYVQLLSQNYLPQDQVDQNNNSSSFLKANQNIQKERDSQGLSVHNKLKEDDDNYFFLQNLKRGSLSILEYNKRIQEQILNIQDNINNLKEQELERLIKKYNNITAEDRLLNVKKIFILMYGFQEGIDWYNKFIRKRNDILMKSVASKTFNFQEYICSKNNQQKIDFMLQQKETNFKIEKHLITSIESSKENEKQKPKNPLQIDKQKELVINRFKILQETPNQIGSKSSLNQAYFTDPFQIFIKQTHLDQLHTQRTNPRDTNYKKNRKSVHFSNQNRQEKNEINQLSSTTLNFSSKYL